MLPAMPTSVSVARQCLTEEAARALDEAVAVARRRSHTQTTSLHAVSALLALPSSTLRDACSRARSSAYPSRLQFRALDLCVGVSLDRLPSSKTLEEPPISNSLMAAIKRSQANQRRHPDNFHMQQIHCNPQTASVLKVEIKHFILSILDDPIVSRVFGEAGFRSCDIKLAIIHPPVMHGAKFSRTGYPPIFFCNLPGSDSGLPRPGFSFPFSTYDDMDDENCKKISEVLVIRKNPLLVGVCAHDTLHKFIECVNTDEGGVLPSEIVGLSVICIEKEINEFVSGGGSDEEKMGLKFKELGQEIGRCSGPGIVVNFGELRVLVSENVSIDAVNYLVSKLSVLLEGFTEKLWLMGAAASYDTYFKFLGRFPSIETDWNLRLLPITSSKSSVDAICSKSSLMGSFVPFGGFFSTPSDFKNSSSSINKSITRCHLCTAKYEQDVATLKMGSPMSVADKYSENLPSWLQMAELDARKEVDAAKAKDDGTTLNTKILELQKKWNDNCQCLHHAHPFSKFDISRVSVDEDVHCAADRKENSSSSGSRDSSLNESQCANLSLGVHMDLQKIILAKHSMPIPVTSEAHNVSFQSKRLEEVSKSQLKERENPWLTPCSVRDISLPTDHTSSSSVTSVTTDLGLGTIYGSSTQNLNAPKLHDHKEHPQLLSGSNSAEFDVISENTSCQVAHPSSCRGPSLGGQFDLRDLKSVRRALAEKIGWQDGAICTISEAVSRCKARCGRHRGSSAKGDIWLAFLGPDKIGKKKIASALAEIMFGSIKSLISVDLSSQDRVSALNSIFGCQELNDYDVRLRGKTVVDYVAEELSKKPHLVVFLENVDKADPLMQKSLSQAMRTGKFLDSHRRPISISNTIFVATATGTVGDKNVLLEKESVKFSEEKIFKAQSWQIRILVEHIPEGASKSNEMNVRVLRNVTSAASANKRKLDGTSDSREQEISPEAKKPAHQTLKSCLDLNLPVEEAEESISYGECENDTISEKSQGWLEDFFDQVDEKVVFKPFDFDALAAKIVKEIGIRFQSVFGPVLLEIDYEVMVQILAASWLSDRNRAVEDWIENVLGRGFSEAWKKYQLGVQCVVKLVTCKGLLVEEQAPGVCLPSKINL